MDRNGNEWMNDPEKRKHDQRMLSFVRHAKESSSSTSRSHFYFANPGRCLIVIKGSTAGVTLRDDDDENNPRWICLLLTTKQNAQTKQSGSKGFFIKSQYEFCLCCCCYGCSCPLLDEWREKYRPRSFPLSSSVVVALWRVRPARHNTRERVQ